MCERRQKRIRAFHDDEGGFSTVGTVLALLITLSLVFTAAQVYQVQSSSCEVQAVADAAVLAAENEVAEFYLIVRLCDALVLSLTLTGIATLGLAIVSFCIPATASLAGDLMGMATKIIEARNSFAGKAAAGLNRLQALLPFLCAANAASVIEANSSESRGTSYHGFAVLLPFEGGRIEVGASAAADDLLEDVQDKQDDIKQAAEEAERAAREANVEKKRAFEADCGNDPGYCMYERAASLTVLPAQDNPLFHSVDTWTFSVALKRAQAYYEARLTQETVSGSTVAEQARSALRLKFYRYAVQEVGRGYVHEDDGGFDAFFPVLPKNTTEMRATSLYTEAVYPMTAIDGSSTLHAWEGCPGIGGGSIAGRGSISQMEAASLTTCTHCGFTAASLGKVAAASTSIDNGFEYHYNIVADSARAYQTARELYMPQAEQVKSLTGGLFDKMKTALTEAASYRIAALPPGRYGALSFVADTSALRADRMLPSSFAGSEATLGTRAAISSATLASDATGEGKTVINSLLDGVVGQGDVSAVGALGVVLDLWSSLLSTYAEGIGALENGVETALSDIPLISDSGLGTWAADALFEVIRALGMQPARLDALKPVLVNSAHVLRADRSSFSSVVLEAKNGCIALGDIPAGDFFSSALSLFESYAFESIQGLGESIEIAVIEPFGEGGPSFPVTIALPPSATDSMAGAVEEAVGSMRHIYAQQGGVRPWE